MELTSIEKLKFREEYFDHDDMMTMAMKRKITMIMDMVRIKTMMTMATVKRKIMRSWTW